MKVRYWLCTSFELEQEGTSSFGRGTLYIQVSNQVNPSFPGLQKKGVTHAGGQMAVTFEPSTQNIIFPHMLVNMIGGSVMQPHVLRLSRTLPPRLCPPESSSTRHPALINQTVLMLEREGMMYVDRCSHYRSCLIEHVYVTGSTPDLVKAVAL